MFVENRLTGQNYYNGTGKVDPSPKERARNADDAIGVFNDAPKEEDDTAPTPNTGNVTQGVLGEKTVPKTMNHEISKSAMMGNELRDNLFRQQKAMQATQNPNLVHQLATGKSMPITGSIGYSKLLPMILGMTAMKYPKASAAGLGTQQLMKMLYENTNPTKDYKDVAFAKSLDNPQVTPGRNRSYEQAKNTKMKLPKFLNYLNFRKN